jgi:transcriptional regulator with XRE-family HTH domain
MNSVALLARNLKRIRGKRKLSQQGVADSSDLSRATVAAIEGRRYASVDTATIEKLARGLGVEPHELIATTSTTQKAG